VPKFETTRRVAYSARQMFDIVADVESYPQFLPLCEGLHVESRQRTGETEVVVATMTVGYKTIHESFRTRVTLHPAEPAIVVEYLDGPFRRLENRWRFLPVTGGSDVHFWIDYEFRSPMLGILMGALFDKAFRRFSAAFEERARHVYGPSATAAV
jgi:coenzyme Q-binding protein COQ10